MFRVITSFRSVDLLRGRKLWWLEVASVVCFSIFFPLFICLLFETPVAFRGPFLDAWVESLCFDKGRFMMDIWSPEGISSSNGRVEVCVIEICLSLIDSFSGCKRIIFFNLIRADVSSGGVFKQPVTLVARGQICPYGAVVSNMEHCTRPFFSVVGLHCIPHLVRGHAGRLKSLALPIVVDGLNSNLVFFTAGRNCAEGRSLDDTGIIVARDDDIGRAVHVSGFV